MTSREWTDQHKRAHGCDDWKTALGFGMFMVIAVAGVIACVAAFVL